ncbi:MAG: hypothetical protein ACYSW3_02240 [Planctomycetota bacterium]
MCKKCDRNPRNRNTRYCDDWWDDISHGGYKGDRKHKQRDYERDKKPKTHGVYSDDFNL